MSTKFTIKYGDEFHLYTDCLDQCQGDDVVHLELQNVQFTAAAPGYVSIELSRELAETLGLVSPRSKGQDQSGGGA